jgi:hypothetical protein
VKKMKIELASLGEYKNQMETEMHNSKQVWNGGELVAMEVCICV